MATGGPFLQTFNQLRTIEWGKSWRWDSQFPTAPPPFNAFFPATEASRGISELENYKFQGFGDTFEIPFNSGLRTFNVTFIDDDRSTLLKWLDDWIELAILGRGLGTARLANIVKPCRLAQLDNTGREVRVWALQVFPYGSLTYAGNSDSEFSRYILSFRIAGIDNPEA